MADVAVVVTSISAPNKFLQALAEGCRQNGYSFILIGDAASPPDFQLEGCRYYSLRDQKTLDFKLAEVCPERHYTRKNVGYLIAACEGVKQIVETDDDNLPYKTFWPRRQGQYFGATLSGAGWVNIYRYFSEANIWPRGFPLEQLKNNPPDFETLKQTDVYCPIQQGLTDNDPDVDAIYRLTSPLPVTFRKEERRIALLRGLWCPFNSQNTTWLKDAFPLLYLPAYCSFRMTDIWRSFVAQRISWTNDWGILFHEPTVWQERNQHDLLKDFAEEVPGYLHNRALCAALETLDLRSGVQNLSDNLRICYEKMVSLKLLPAQELTLLDAWLADLGEIIGTPTLKLPFRATGD